MVVVTVEGSADWHLFVKGQLLIKKGLDKRTHIFIGLFFFFF